MGYVSPIGFRGSWNQRRPVTLHYTASATAGNIIAAYQEDTSPISGQSEDVPLTEITADLNTKTVEQIVPGSLVFTLNGEEFVDRDGTLYRSVDPATGAGTEAGVVNYEARQVTLTNWSAGAGNINVRAMLLEYSPWVADTVTFRVAAAPLRPGSLYVRGNAPDGTIIDGQADQNGDITGNGITGGVDVETGIVELNFDEPGALPTTLLYNAVAITYLPLDADLLGIDPVRLPQDGRVPLFRPGDVAVIHHEDELALPTLDSGQQIDLGRTRISRFRIEDAEGKVVDPALYTADLDAGTVTMADPLDLSGYTAPFKAIHRIEDMSLVTDAQITGHITLMRPVSHDYPANETRVSSALIAGDLQARVANIFDQATWTGVWSDELIGDEPTAEYNSTTYPIQVTNRGAITERWALIFTSSTSYRIVGESVGEIGIGNTSSETAPINPNTNVPYFVIDPLGWGTGWSTGNVLRFNTIGASFPVWISRTILQGPASGEDDEFRIQIRGNANQ